MSGPNLGLLLLTASGAILTAHGSSMAWRALRTGTASAQYAEPSRPARPVASLVTVLVNLATALFGFFLLVIGLIFQIGPPR